MNLLDRVRDLPNERSVELPWLLAQPLTAPILDVGCVDSIYLSELPGPVDGIDLRATSNQALRRAWQADIRSFTSPEKYPTITAISSIEHVGLAFEPYGTEADDPDGDRHAIEGIMRNLTLDGVLYLTVPFGPFFIDREWYRVFDEDALGNLLQGMAWTAEYVFDAAWEVGGVALVTARL